MQEQLFFAQRVAVEDVAVLVGADIHLLDENLAALDRCVGIGKVDLARADGFHLRAEELNSGFQNLVYEIIVPRFLVLRQRL